MNKIACFEIKEGRRVKYVNFSFKKLQIVRAASVAAFDKIFPPVYSKY